IHLDAAHHVVGSWPHLHWVLGNIDVGKLLKLVIHAGELSLDMLGGVRQPLLDPGDVEKDTAVGTAPTLADLADYAASDVVAGQQFRGPSSVLIALSVAPALFFGSGGRGAIVLGYIVEHEAAAVFIGQDTALAAHAFGDEYAADSGRPDHAGGVELDE